jgi:transposase
MGRAIALRTDYRSVTFGALRSGCNAAHVRRLLAIAAALDGATREEAAKIGGMDRQTPRDWVIRFNEQGSDGLINKSSPGAPDKLTGEHKAFLAGLVEDGSIPAIDGVVRWRACDFIMRLHQEFGYRSRTILPRWPRHSACRPSAWR